MAYRRGRGRYDFIGETLYTNNKRGVKVEVWSAPQLRIENYGEKHIEIKAISRNLSARPNCIVSFRHSLRVLNICLINIYLYTYIYIYIMGLYSYFMPQITSWTQFVVGKQRRQLDPFWVSFPYPTPNLLLKNIL
jgi:hypothetical protein